MREIIFLRDLASLLNVKDVRTAKAYCRKHGIQIFKDDGVKKPYILKLQFEFQRHKNVIEYLKVKYGNQWLGAFQSYMSLNLLQVVEFEASIEGKLKEKKNTYKPKGEKEKEFLQKLLSKINS